MDISVIQNHSPPQAEVLRDSVAREALAQTAAQTVAARPEPVNMELVLRELQQVSEAFNRRLSFAINEKLDQVVVKVIDSETDKIIKEIPPVELQHVHERIRDVIGILFDEEA